MEQTIIAPAEGNNAGFNGGRWDLPKQTIFRDDTANVAGDCWRCCIAAVLGRPASAVPHFLQECRANGDGDMDLATQRWLKQEGYFMLHARGLSFPGDWTVDLQVPVIVCGPTRRSKLMGDNHAVIYIGREMVYDPHPDNFGILAITDQYLIAPLSR